MWSDRSPIERVSAVQFASARVTQDRFDAFVAAVTSRAKAPFDQEPECHVPRFGKRPHAVLVKFERGHLVVRNMEREPEVANPTLHAFLESIASAAAKEAGIELELSPAELKIPPTRRKQHLVLSQARELAPRYRAFVPVEGEQKVIFQAWTTGDVALNCMGGHEVSFEVPDPPDNAVDVALIDAAITNMQKAGRALLENATEHVYAYYLDCVRGFSPDEMADYGMPTITHAKDVWDHVQLGRFAYVYPSTEASSACLHKNTAYVSLSCECDWEIEHGLCLVFIDGERLGRVSACDGHTTWASAYADSSLLDVIYRRRG